MKVKNVLSGLQKQYALEEVNILNDEKVIFSGSMNQWKATSVDMILYKREVENSEVKKRMIFNHRKAFIFI